MAVIVAAGSKQCRRSSWGANADTCCRAGVAGDEYTRWVRQGVWYLARDTNRAQLCTTLVYTLSVNTHEWPLRSRI